MFICGYLYLCLVICLECFVCGLFGYYVKMCFYVIIFCYFYLWKIYLVVINDKGLFKNGLVKDGRICNWIVLFVGLIDV